jgi:hypothetical protein
MNTSKKTRSPAATGSLGAERSTANPFAAPYTISCQNFLHAQTTAKENLDQDDHFGPPFLFMAMKANLQT